MYNCKAGTCKIHARTNKFYADLSLRPHEKMIEPESQQIKSGQTRVDCLTSSEQITTTSGFSLYPVFILIFPKIALTLCYIKM